MSIEIQCVGCGSHLRVADEHAGKQARCPKCGSIQTIPGEKAANAAELQASTDPPASPAPSPAAPPVGELPTRNPSVAAPSEVPPTLTDEWFLKTPDGREYGPVPRRDLDAWVGEQRVSGQCRVRRGLDDWMPATHLYPNLPLGAFQDVTIAPSMATLPTTIYPETHRGGVILALGIMGLVCTCPVLSIAAWVMGAKDLAKMQAGVMDPAGHDMTKVGYVLGAFWALICILFSTIVMLMVLASNT